jgi:hypothetical protein
MDNFIFSAPAEKGKKKKGFETDDTIGWLMAEVIATSGRDATTS